MLTHTFAAKTELFVFVKRISGSGAFTLSGATFRCGDGSVAPGEECDDGNLASGDCCSATCQIDPDQTACTAGHCTAGGCVDGPPVPNGAVDDGGTPEGGSDAGVDATPPPFVEPEPTPTPAPTVTPPNVTPPPVTVPASDVEQYEPAGGGCTVMPGRTTSPARDLMLALVLGIPVARVAVRRRRRAG